MRIVSAMLLAVMAPWGATLAAEEAPPPDPAAVLLSLPKSVTSSDGFVKVIAADVPGDEIGFRGPILQFSTGIVDKLGRTLALAPLPRRREPGLVIHAQDGRTNDARVIVRFVRRRQGVTTRIWLPSPGYSDLALFRKELARAYFRAVVDAHVELPLKPGALPPAEFPDWLIDGILNLTDPGKARASLRGVLERWSSAKLPFFPAVCKGSGQPDEVCTYLAGWLKERRLYPKLFSDCARGRVWTAAELAAHLTEKSEALEQDAANDRRMLRIMSKVISPGVTSPTDLNVFASRLRLYPSYFDRGFGVNSFGCTFHEALELYFDDSEVRLAAARKAREVPLYALGRGEELQRAAIAYMEFLMALAGKAKPARAAELLAAADGKLQAVQAAVLRKELER